MESKFTWFSKMTSTVAKVPEEQRGKLLWALVTYGTYGEEPSLGYPLDAIFESLREDIDNSKNAIYNGKTGGRGKKKGSSGNAEPPLDNGETPLAESVNPPFEYGEDYETPLCDGENGGSEDAKPIPVHTTPIQSIPLQSNTGGERATARFRAPTPEEVSGYAEDNGLALDAARFCDFYASKGWKVGKSPMKDWRASARNWARADGRKGGGPDGEADEYSEL